MKKRKQIKEQLGKTIRDQLWDVVGINLYNGLDNADESAGELGDNKLDIAFNNCFDDGSMGAADPDWGLGRPKLQIRHSLEFDHTPTLIKKN